MPPGAFLALPLPLPAGLPESTDALRGRLPLLSDRSRLGPGAALGVLLLPLPVVWDWAVRPGRDLDCELEGLAVAPPAVAAAALLPDDDALAAGVGAGALDGTEAGRLAGAASADCVAGGAGERVLELVAGRADGWEEATGAAGGWLARAGVRGFTAGAARPLAIEAGTADGVAGLSRATPACPPGAAAPGAPLPVAVLGAVGFVCGVSGRAITAALGGARASGGRPGLRRTGGSRFGNAPDIRKGPAAAVGSSCPAPAPRASCWAPVSWPLALASLAAGPLWA